MRAYLPVAVALITACSGAATSDDIDEVVESLNLIAETYCAHLESCGVTPPAFLYSGCTQTQRSEPSIAELRDNLERGIAVYSPEAAERCLQAIASDTCPIEPRLGTPDFPGAVYIDLDLDDDAACYDVLYVRNPGLPPSR